MRKKLMLSGAVALTVGALVAVPGAMAGSGDGRFRNDVRVSRVCTDSSTSKLKLGTDNGKVEVEFEVDENRVGTTWNVTIRRNGVQVVSRLARTRAPSGSFEVRALIAPGSPRTKVTAVARRAATGEVCRATATL